LHNPSALEGVKLRARERTRRADKTSLGRRARFNAAAVASFGMAPRASEHRADASFERALALAARRNCSASAALVE
jgi:hypothetical protein